VVRQCVRYSVVGQSRAYSTCLSLSLYVSFCCVCAHLGRVLWCHTEVQQMGSMGCSMRSTFLYDINLLQLRSLGLSAFFVCVGVWVWLRVVMSVCAVRCAV